MNIKIKTYMLFLKDRISASMTKRISGIKEIILKRRISLNSLKTTTEVPAPVGIKEEITIIESKTLSLPSFLKRLVNIKDNHPIEYDLPEPVVC